MASGTGALGCVFDSCVVLKCCVLGVGGGALGGVVGVGVVVKKLMLGDSVALVRCNV